MYCKVVQADPSHDMFQGRDLHVEDDSDGHPQVAPPGPAGVGRGRHPPGRDHQVPAELHPGSECVWLSGHEF